MEITLKSKDSNVCFHEKIEVNDEFKKAVELSKKYNKGIKPNIVVYLFKTKVESDPTIVKAIWSYENKDEYNNIHECYETTCELEIKYKDSYELICKEPRSFAAIRISVNSVGKNFSRKQLISKAFNDLIVRTLNDYS